MRTIWLSSLLLCAAACATMPKLALADKPAAKSEAPPQFVMVDGAANAHYSTWTQENTSAPRACLTKEPEYKSAPIYFNLELGNAKDRFITLALDESGGPGKGYDTLYVDGNNHGDLTDCPPVKLVVQQQAAQYSNFTAKEPIALTVRYHDGTSRQMLTRISNFSNNRYGNNQSNWSLNCNPAQHVEGKVMFGGKPVLVGIYDSSPASGSADACFDGYGTDRLRIDLNGDGKLTPDEESPLSRVVSCDGKLWELEVSSAATQVTARPCGLPSAPLAVAAAFAKDAKLVAGKIELGNHAGIALSARFAEGAPTVVPAGKYRVTSASLTLADASGKNWEAAFTCPRAVQVAAATGASLSFGMPIKVEPVISSMVMNPNDSANVYKLGGQIQVSYGMAGPGGERYSSIAPQGARPGQKVRILDSEGIEVASGSMEYG
jgi:hypothetical protein